MLHKSRFRIIKERKTRPQIQDKSKKKKKKKNRMPKIADNKRKKNSRML